MAQVDIHFTVCVAALHYIEIVMNINTNNTLELIQCLLCIPIDSQDCYKVVKLSCYSSMYRNFIIKSQRSVSSK